MTVCMSKCVYVEMLVCIKFAFLFSDNYHRGSELSKPHAAEPKNSKVEKEKAKTLTTHHF